MPTITNDIKYVSVMEYCTLKIKQKNVFAILLISVNKKLKLYQ